MLALAHEEAYSDEQHKFFARTGLAGMTTEEIDVRDDKAMFKLVCHLQDKRLQKWAQQSLYGAQNAANSAYMTYNSNYTVLFSVSNSKPFYILIKVIARGILY